MTALRYLLGTQLKNRLRAFFRKPANWVALLLMLGLCGLMIFTGNLEVVTGARGATELYAIVALLYIAMFATMVYGGLRKGASCFALSDVHMLFTAPVDPRATLLYGLVKQMGTALLTGFFILYQYGWMHQTYDVSLGFLVAVLVGYGLTIFAAQLTALTLYSLTAEKPRARALCVRRLLALCGLAAVYAVTGALNDQPNWLARLCEGVVSPVVSLFPVGGWLAAAVRGLREGQISLLLLGLAAYLVYGFGMIFLLRRAHGNYFEDVLAATETTHAQKEAVKDGKAVEMLPSRVKAGRTGLRRGAGASVLYSKQCLESRRARRLIFEPMTLIFMVVTIAYGFFMRESGVWPIFAFATYMQLFSAGNARWVKELQRPYVYLLPDAPFRKLLWCMAEGVRAALLEAAVTFGALGAILQLSVWEIGCLIAARFAVGLLLMSGNLLLERLFSGVKAKGLVLFLYFLTMIVLLIPCIVLAVLAPMWIGAIGTATATSLLAITACAAVVALLVTFLCRNLLRDAEVG